MNALGGRGMYEASRFLAWEGREIPWDGTILSSRYRGDAGGDGVMDVVSGETSRLVDSLLLNVIGVMSVKKVNVIDGFGFSTRAGIPSGEQS